MDEEPIVHADGLMGLGQRALGYPHVNPHGHAELERGWSLSELVRSVQADDEFQLWGLKAQQDRVLSRPRQETGFASV